MHSNRSWWVHRRPLHHPPCLPLRIKTCGNFFAQHPLRNHHVGNFSSTQRVRISLRVVTILSKHVIAGYGSKSKTVKVSLVDQYSLKGPSCHRAGDSIPFQAIGRTDQIGCLMKTHDHDQETKFFDDFVPVKSKYAHFSLISCAQRSEG